MNFAEIPHIIQNKMVPFSEQGLADEESWRWPSSDSFLTLCRAGM